MRHINAVIIGIRGGNVVKKTVAWILTAAVTASLLSGCTPEPAPTESPQPTEQVETEGTYIPGSYTATAKGYGGDVSVTVTVDAGCHYTGNSGRAG